MFKLRRFALALWLVALSLSLAFAQEGKNITAQPSTPTITASATTDGVRFAALSDVTEMRIAIYSPTGEQLFDSGFRKGALIDWSLKDSPGVLIDGSYLCIVTYRDLQGRLRQKSGALSMQNGQHSLRQSTSQSLSSEQSAALAASRKEQPLMLESDGALTILTAEPPAVTLTMHDGADGQLVSTTGGLTFRTGDFFGGADKVRMRITGDGRVGIGVDDPQAMFDVAGAIRARGGIIFSDGTALTSMGRAGRVNSLGDVVPNAAGTGTQNFIAKWLETGGAGTLGDSAIFETGGRVGINTTTPAQPFTVRQNNGTAGVNLLGELFVDRDNLSRSSSVNMATAGVNKWLFGMPFNSNGFHIFDLQASPFPGVSRFFVDPVSGNVGVGTTTPGARLDVAGIINTSTQYNLGGARILIAPGNNNLFAGVGSGAANPTGSNNSFFGTNAGSMNTSGLLNSFFGNDAGLSNTEGFSNSFFGESAGQSNTLGDANSFFGSGAGELNTEGTSNSFFGTGAGAANQTGSQNAFFGRDAGRFQATGVANSFFGFQAGRENRRAFNNSFFGWNAGANNNSDGGNLGGGGNSFFGSRAGVENISGEENSFFGFNAGAGNMEGQQNSFFGWNAGVGNSTGNNNSFFGIGAGENNEGGNNNTIIGASADVATENLVYATAIGSDARVSNSNSIVLGRSMGQDTVRIPGSLVVTGVVSKGGGSFKIDHPLDPLNKTLSHSFVESPDMMNVYNGNITTDAKGMAIVRLPDYFEALNRDFRYQLTVIGQFAQAIVLKKIAGNRFQIKTNKPRVEVSWQVTGIRKDAYANTHRIPVEEDKPEQERGAYLHPDAFDWPAEQSVKQAAPAKLTRRTKVSRAKRPTTARR